MSCFFSRYHWWVLSRLVPGNSICFFFVWIDIWEKKAAWPLKKGHQSKNQWFEVKGTEISHFEPKNGGNGGGWKMIFFSVSKKGLCFFLKVPACSFSGVKNVDLSGCNSKTAPCHPCHLGWPPQQLPALGWLEAHPWRSARWSGSLREKPRLSKTSRNFSIFFEMVL